MSQKSHTVFSQQSQTKSIPTERELKFEIFAKLPLAVFQRYTNVRSLILKKFNKQKWTNFQVNRKIVDYHSKLTQPDAWNGLLKNLEFVDSNVIEKYAALINCIFLRNFRNCSINVCTFLT